MPLPLTDLQLGEHQEMLQVIVQFSGQSLALLLLGKVQFRCQGPELLRALGDSCFEVLRQISQGFFSAFPLDNFAQEKGSAPQPRLGNRHDELRARRHAGTEFTKLISPNSVTFGYLNQLRLVLRRIPVPNADASDGFSVNLDRSGVDMDPAIARQIDRFARIHRASGYVAA